MTDKELIDKARAVGVELRACPGDRDRLAGWLLKELADECGKLTVTVAAFDEVASILADFDWEHDDRQYALERIEMIVLPRHDEEGSDDA
jgi:hypothetical protein